MRMMELGVQGRASKPKWREACDMREAGVRCNGSAGNTTHHAVKCVRVASPSLVLAPAGMFHGNVLAGMKGGRVPELGDALHPGFNMD